MAHAIKIESKAFERSSRVRIENIFSIHGFEKGVGNGNVDCFCGVIFAISALVAG